MTDFPLPGMGTPVVAVPAPGSGDGWWAGSSSAALDADGSFVIAYRVRTGHAGRGSTVVARSPDGEHLTTVAHLDQARFGAASMERPSIVRTDEGRWRLYVCSATPPPSKHWWIDLLEADDPADLATADARTVFAGDEQVGVKDPLVQRTPDGGWQAWICCHPLDEPDEEDRMTTAYATSADGVAWEWHGTVLAPRPGTWDQRGARVTAVLPDGRAAYDGRASKEENWFERTGLARLTGRRPGELEQAGDEAVRDVRYLDVLPLPEGGYRIWYEARLPDLSHELRTERIDALAAIKQRARATWAAGDYDAVAEGIWRVGEVVVDRAEVRAGNRVLDVACGTGNAATRAALAGGSVVGLDITPELFPAARRRAAEARVEIDLIEGDAEALPFEDASFDVVLSTFGVMFAPRHDVAAAEIVRVLRPGGRIGIASWAPDGTVGAFFAAVARHMPAPPPVASSPILWGTREHVRALFVRSGIDLAFSLERVPLKDGDPDAAPDFFLRNFGPLVTARAVLEPKGRWDALEAEVRPLIARMAKVPPTYLLVTGTKDAVARG